MQLIEIAVSNPELLQYKLDGGATLPPSVSHRIIPIKNIPAKIAFKNSSRP